MKTGRINVKVIEPIRKPDRAAKLAGLGLDVTPTPKGAVVKVNGVEVNLNTNPKAIYNKIMLDGHSISKPHHRSKVST